MAALTPQEQYEMAQKDAEEHKASLEATGNSNSTETANEANDNSIIDNQPGIDLSYFDGPDFSGPNFDNNSFTEQNQFQDNNKPDENYENKNTENKNSIDDYINQVINVAAEEEDKRREKEEKEKKEYLKNKYGDAWELLNDERTLGQKIGQVGKEIGRNIKNIGNFILESGGNLGTTFLDKINNFMNNLITPDKDTAIIGGKEYKYNYNDQTQQTLFSTLESLDNIEIDNVEDAIDIANAVLAFENIYSSTDTSFIDLLSNTNLRGSNKNAIKKAISSLSNKIDNYFTTEVIDSMTPEQRADLAAIIGINNTLANFKSDSTKSLMGKLEGKPGTAEGYESIVEDFRNERNQLQGQEALHIATGLLEDAFILAAAAQLGAKGIKKGFESASKLGKKGAEVTEELGKKASKSALAKSEALTNASVDDVYKLSSLPEGSAEYNKLLKKINEQGVQISNQEKLASGLEQSAKNASEKLSKLSEDLARTGRNLGESKRFSRLASQLDTVSGVAAASSIPTSIVERNKPENKIENVEGKSSNEKTETNENKKIIETVLTTKEIADVLDVTGSEKEKEEKINEISNDVDDLIAKNASLEITPNDTPERKVTKIIASKVVEGEGPITSVTVFSAVKDFINDLEDELDDDTDNSPIAGYGVEAKDSDPKRISDKYSGYKENAKNSNIAKDYNAGMEEETNEAVSDKYCKIFKKMLDKEPMYIRKVLIAIPKIHSESEW